MRLLTVALLVHQHFGIQTTTRSQPAVVVKALVTSPQPNIRSLRLFSSSPSAKTALNMVKRVLVPIAEGSEEIETTCITDTLTRFGAEVTIASVMPDLLCKMSRGIKVMADMSIEDAAKEEYDLVVCPGGMPGATHLRDSETLKNILEKQNAAGKPYGAICAAPAVVLATHQLLDDKATCYPAPQFREKLQDPVDDVVAVTGGGLITTSKGPGTALLFALELGEQLYGKEARNKIQKEMLV
ncbi:hypothetical protein IV203_021745 [Nitzschia inconspicua]|uniref:DJ-1/PfpI domain-containing protein n=1 Tax=Nitzschia inconspicua TaxID=303405 RepID=A0A9K3PDK1_9STRA|nr:hypothetical protein IV203_021745 [Nitzschia inconspicua]